MGGKYKNKVRARYYKNLRKRDGVISKNFNEHLKLEKLASSNYINSVIELNLVYTSINHYTHKIKNADKSKFNNSLRVAFWQP